MTGATGPTGPTGPTGATGATGADGLTPTITVGTTTTGLPGTEADVTIDGTAPNYTLNFTIPQGPTGPQFTQAYLSASSTSNSAVANNAPFLFDTTVDMLNIANDENGTFTINETGIYLVEWNVNVQPSQNEEVVAELVGSTPANIQAVSASGATIQSTATYTLNGFGIIDATAGDTYQLINASANSVTPQTGTTSSVRILFIRIA